MIFEPIFGAARLANLGIAALVAETCFWRLVERWNGKKVTLAMRRLNVISPDVVILLGLLFATSSFAFLTLPVTHYLFQWPSNTHVPALEMIALWLKGLMGAVLVMNLAHFPHRKRAVLIGWTLAVHFFILGPVLWAHMR